MGFFSLGTAIALRFNDTGFRLRRNSHKADLISFTSIDKVKMTNLAVVFMAAAVLTERRALIRAANGAKHMLNRTANAAFAKNAALDGGDRISH